MASPLQIKRLSYKPRTPKMLMELFKLEAVIGKPTSSKTDQEELKNLFPKTYGQPIVQFKTGKAPSHKLNIGVVFSGGQAAGGHNVIAGLFDALISLNPDSTLIGFLNGPSGIIDNKTKPITKELLQNYRNQGGFDLIGSGRTKIETDEQLSASLNSVKDLDGLVVIGGDDSNTNAAVLAEYFLQKGVKTSVIGVPKTIDGDLRNEYVEISFGFDTASKIYGELIGNIARDALSAKKYYHFIKLMGRSASHIALECALSTHPNYTLLSEEIAHQKKTLLQIVQDLAHFIEERAKSKKEYGIVLIPEGIIEFMSDVKMLISELNRFLPDNEKLSLYEKKKKLVSVLSKDLLACFNALGEKIQDQLLLERDPHGNVQVSLIETEKLLGELVRAELAKRKIAFRPLYHFFGYEGRSAMPSNFDAEYAYALGQVSALLLSFGFTGYMACVHGITSPLENWQAMGLPLTMFLNLEMRKGKKKPVIKKALVDLDGKAFKVFSKNRQEWMMKDDYRYPGPIQFFGDLEVTDSLPLTLAIY